MLYRVRFDSAVGKYFEQVGLSSAEAMQIWPSGATKGWINHFKPRGWKPKDAALAAVGYEIAAAVESGLLPHGIGYVFMDAFLEISRTGFRNGDLDIAASQHLKIALKELEKFSIEYGHPFRHPAEVYGHKVDTNKEGPFTTWYSNGQVDKKGTVRDGVLDGSYEWHQNSGQLNIKCTYANGLKHGEYFEYVPNGQLYRKGLYTMGVKCGEWWEGELDRAQGTINGGRNVAYRPCEYG